MGEVYQATDSQFGRSVAIKLLPEALTHDTERVVRFEREARVLASLNHTLRRSMELRNPAVGSFLMMELARGDTLAESITRGPIPVEESPPI